MKQFKPEDWGPYGNALVALGRGKEAKQLFLDFIALNAKSMDSVKADSANCDVYFNLASLYMAPPQGSTEKPNYDSAAFYFERKIACEPKSLSSYVNGAACYLQIKNYGRARELLSKALELKPDFLQGRLWFARYYAAVDSLEEAIGQYDQVLKEIGSDVNAHKREAAEAYQMKSALNFQAKRYAAVIEDLRKAQPWASRMPASIFPGARHCCSFSTRKGLARKTGRRSKNRSPISGKPLRLTRTSPRHTSGSARD